MNWEWGTVMTVPINGSRYISKVELTEFGDRLRGDKKEYRVQHPQVLE